MPEKGTLLSEVFFARGSLSTGGRTDYRKLTDIFAGPSYNGAAN